jgi:hypothetical protein
MRRLTTMWLTTLALAAAAGPARAQTSQHAAPGDRGSVVISAERLFGLTFASQSGGNDVTSITFFGAGGAELAASPYSIPRLSLDYFIDKSLSLGAGLQIAHYSEDQGGDITVFGFEPRVGYLVRLNEGLSIWPRGGFSYVHLDQGNGAYLLALTLEAPFVLAAFPHVAFMGGPALDIGIGATGGNATQIGLNAGLAVWW